MTFGTEFWAAIAGAVVGGVIALGLQLIAIWAGRRDREADRKEVQKALALSAFFKTMKIASNLFQFHLHMEEAFAAVDRKVHSEPWTFVLPIANLPDAVHYTTDEQALVLSFDKVELSDKLMSLDAVHNGLVRVFETYAIMRKSFLDGLPAEMSEGNVGKSTFDKEQMKVLRPKMVEMNMLGQAMRDNAKFDYEESRGVLETLQSAVKEKMKIEIGFEEKPHLKERIEAATKGAV